MHGHRHRPGAKQTLFWVLLALLVILALEVSSRVNNP